MSIDCSPAAPAVMLAAGLSGRAAPARDATNSAPQPSGAFSSLLQGLGETMPDTLTVSTASPAQSPAQSPAPPTAASSLDATPSASARSDQTELLGPPLIKEQEQAQTQSPAPAPDAAMQALLVQFLRLAAQPTVQPQPAPVPNPAPSSASAVRLQASAAPMAAPSAAPASPGAQRGPAAEAVAVADSASATRWLPKPAAVAPGAQTTAATDTLPWSFVGVAPVEKVTVANAKDVASWQSTISTQSAVQELRAAASHRDAATQPLSEPGSDFVRAAAVTGLVASLSGSESGASARKRGAGAAPSVGGDAPSASAPGSVTGSSSALSVGASSATAPAQGVEQAVAEQVKYWISNDVHNAQLKFSGLGEASVQVNISMSGSQAQVVFQSDQAHTRALLGNAMTQLDQMMRAQGLTLTSAWVSSSGQQGQFGANPQAPQPASALTPASASVQPLAPLPAPASKGVPSDRVVDLFV